VMLWDRGYWAPEAGFEEIGQALSKGELKFVMEGQRMHGSWVLVRTRRDERGRANWILIKHRDEAAVPGNAGGPSDTDQSVASSRTMSEIATGGARAAKPFMTAVGAEADAVWQSNRDGNGQPGLDKPSKPSEVAKKAKTVTRLPDFIAPQLTKSVKTPPLTPGWAHEIKFDGYRMRLRVAARKATLKTRNGLDWSDRYPEVVASGSGLKDGIYDGEVVALNEAGTPDFAALQAASAEGAQKTWCSSYSTSCSTSSRISGHCRSPSERPG
jgi:bifunctional non-homologous end joining protein LigD